MGRRETKGRIVSFRTSSAKYERLMVLSEKSGLSMSDYMRGLCDRFLESNAVS